MDLESLDISEKTTGSRILATHSLDAETAMSVIDQDRER